MGDNGQMDFHSFCDVERYPKSKTTEHASNMLRPVVEGSGTMTRWVRIR